MSLKIPIETSARHVHVSEADFKKLFGEDATLTCVHELSQPGQYLCKERITIVGPKGKFENVHSGFFHNSLKRETQMSIKNNGQK